MNEINHGPFTVADFAEVAALSIGVWSAVPDDDWASPAATLEWSRFETADHTIDCVFSYAFFLASRSQDAYPPFGEVHALDGATRPRRRSARDDESAHCCRHHRATGDAVDHLASPEADHWCSE